MASDILVLKMEIFVCFIAKKGMVMDTAYSESDRLTGK
jgi:hypothetical protein